MAEHDHTKHSVPRQMVVWNLLDHLRLLWWILITPQKLVDYWEAYGGNSEQRVGKVLMVELKWLALFAILCLLTIPKMDLFGFLRAIGLMAVLLLMELFAFTKYSLGHIAKAILFSTMTMIVAVFLPIFHFSTTIALVIVAAFYSFLEHNDAAIEKIVQGDLANGQPSRLIQGSFIVFIVAFFVLLWTSQGHFFASGLDANVSAIDCSSI